MSDLWRRQIEAELERLSKSKGVPSLGILEESVDPEKEGIAWKSSEDREDRIEVPAEVPVELPEKIPHHGEEFKPSWVLVANLANRLKKTVVEMRRLTESSPGRFKDLALGQEFQRRMTDHIDNSEIHLDCFLDYLRMKSPVRQTNMAHVILEEILEKQKKKLVEKEIKIFKKQYEEDLPEARVHVEELRFILNWVLEYAIISAVPDRSIGFMTKSLEVQGGTKCIEILIFLGDHEKPGKQIGVPPKIKTAHNEGDRSCILPFVDEIVRENRGLLKLFADGEGRLRIISLRLPIERRRVVHYQQALA